MTTSSSKRPVLALEDLEDVSSGMNLDEMMAGSDEPITSPFIAKAKAEAEETHEDPFMPDVVPELTDDLDLLDIEPEVELEPEPEPEPVIEKPKRTRRSSAEVAAEKVTKVAVVEDDAFTLESSDDLDLVDSMPDPKATVDAFKREEALRKSVESREAVAPYDPIEALITPVGDVPEWMTIVVYGKNGTGKTTFGASGKKTLVLEVEKDGTFSVRERGSEAKKFKIKSWDDFEKIYWYLKKNPGLYEILCIDTLTRLSELCMRSVVLNKKAEGAELLDKDLVRVTLPQYGDIGKRMTFWLQAFADLPLHKVWLCQEASGSDDMDVASIDAYPDLSRKIRVYVCSDATIIGRTEIKFKSEIVGGVEKKVPQFILRVAPSEEYLSKDRTKSLGSGLLNPKIDKMIAKVYGE